jgi:hypothetical protein
MSAKPESDIARLLEMKEATNSGGLPRGDFYRIAKSCKAKAADGGYKEHDQRKL